MMIDCTNEPRRAEITGPHPGWWPWSRYQIRYRRSLEELAWTWTARTLPIAERKARRRVAKLEAARLAYRNVRTVR